MLFEGKINFQGSPEELASNEIVRRKYLGVNFELTRKRRSANSSATAEESRRE
jgi:lipopolysaccharide export system ATP-binding protein